MNSQIYCLPQKLGWNNYKEIAWEIKEEEERYIKNRTTRPYFVTDLDRDKHDPQVLKEFKARYPHFPDAGPATDEAARRLAFVTETKAEFKKEYLQPMRRPAPPVNYEILADPVQRRRIFDTPMDTILGDRKSRDNKDIGKDRTNTSYGMWQPLERIPILTNVGERFTLPPVRLRKNDPVRQKAAWDYAKHLGCQDAFSYGYRQQLSGYGGHVPMDTHVDSSLVRDAPNPAMETTAQASYRQYPNEMYSHGPTQQENKHQGPLSRMVTITHPFNPFTQQSAYCHVGASGTE